MGDSLLCSVDVGTSGIRLSLYGEDLGLVARYTEELTLYYSGNRVEQDALILAANVRDMLGKAARSGCNVVGLSIYRGSVVAWRNGKPLSDVITWMDSRGLEEYSKLPLGARLVSKSPVLGKALKPGSPALVMRRLWLNHPGARIWSIDGFLSDMLTGEFTSDPGQAALTGLVSPYSLKPLSLVIRLLGLRGLELPRLRLHNEPLTRVGGVLVGPMVADQQAASIGLGCLRPGCVKATLGTGLFLDAPVEGKPPLFTGDLIPVVNLALPGRVYYGLEGFAAGVGMVFDAFARVLGGFSVLEEKALEPADPAPVVPVLAGLRTPYRPLLRGAVLGVSPGFTAASLAKGLIIGTLLTVLSIYRELARRMGGFGELRIGGGLSRLGLLASSIASAVGVKVYRSVDYNDSARGAALVAGYASDLISREELLNPPVSLVEVEPLEELSLSGVDAWLGLVDALASEDFSRRLEEIRRSSFRR
ncbi:putative carbohydrate kinase [Aeropyrum pernix K1]|uniref:Carbohydrate kinase n=1 Tax=Aeropyrum pernix (strain ATCC 700893 / DSM 11879 / JCM 9820 / NBRC 100138 / K1) TaxID=272557 RepID=Q9YFD5_AERPE|nr:FGGY-family carbohydrate kinase [Aeropyrum pernix]BAA79261.2 putative carbohydrate kinase [Aeropyrum pernix K1]